MRLKRIGMAIVTGLIFLSVAVAQEVTPPVTRQQRGTRGTRQEGERQRQVAPRQMQGQFDSRQMQERMLERMKDSLKASDEEWKVIKPRLEEVINLSSRQRMRVMDGRSNAASVVDATPVQKASQELQAILAKADSKPQDISAKLTALREARKKADTNLEKARKSLKELLTQRQEAQLVLMGILE